MTKFTDNQIEWKEEFNSFEWDACLTSIQGHPLQSEVWGKSKKNSCGIKDYKWAAYKDNQPIFMARFEERRFMKFFKIAWLPKGPAIFNHEEESALYQAFCKKLRKSGYFLCAFNPWKKVEPLGNPNKYFYTIWIDLTLPKDILWEKLNKQCRYDIRRAKKLGVTVEQTTSLDDLKIFNDMCNSISKSKGFDLGNSTELMNQLFSMGNSSVETNLFVARHEQKICGGAFIIRCGKNLHYIWGAVNRQFSHLCIGEILQWEIIEWGITQNCIKYDLEGISNTNGGVDRFKKKFGGEIIASPQIQLHSLFLAKPIASFLLKLYFFLKPKLARYHFFKN